MLTDLAVVLAHTQGVPGSNLGPETGYLDRIFFK